MVMEGSQCRGGRAD